MKQMYGRVAVALEKSCLAELRGGLATPRLPQQAADYNTVVVVAQASPEKVARTEKVGF